MTETTPNVKAAVEKVASAPTDAKVPNPEGEGYSPLGQKKPTKEEKETPKDAPTSGTKPQDITVNPFEDRPSVVHLEDEVSSISKEAQVRRVDHASTSAHLISMIFSLILRE
jgi:hypothetical protein